MRDTDWVADIYDRTYEMLHDIGCLFIGRGPGHAQQVDDEIQAIFVTLLERQDKLKNHPNIEGWLVTSLRYRLLNLFRKLGRERTQFPFSLDDADQSAAKAQAEKASVPGDILESMIEKERREMIEKLIGPDNMRLFIRYCVEKTPARVLAEEYRISESAVWMKANRLRKKILEHPEIFSVVVLMLCKVLAVSDIYAV